MNRFGAFLIHLGISLAIFAVLAYLVLYVWYPDFFFNSDGGWQGMRIIVFVDLVLGPALTLVVFNRKKPARELRRDLAIIGTVQAVCLVAGVFVVHQARPIALVYVDGTFYTMTAGAYQEQGQTVPDLSSMPGPWPKRVIVALPDDYAEQSRIRKESLENRIPLRVRSEYYQPLTFDALDFAREGKTAKEIEATLKNPEPMEDWLAVHTLDDGTRFFRFSARYGYQWLAASPQSEAFLGTFAPATSAADG